jgi:hypothetical protein
MNFFKVIENLKSQDLSLILFCLLDRIPIIVYGDNPKDINNFLVDLSDLIHFREENVYFTDFISTAEYNVLTLNENVDYYSQRVLVRCPTAVAHKALINFDQFDSWIIGIEISKDDEEIQKFINYLKKTMLHYPQNCFLAISYFNNLENVSLEGLNHKIIDLSLENEIFKKISEGTKQSITKMKRVLSEIFKTKSIDDGLLNALLDFECEKEILKLNILKKEIQSFYAGSKRAFFILSRLNRLNSINITPKIGSKALLESIDYTDASIGRILTFISREWRKDFSSLIEINNK